jgi:rhodanese-related sulfurtransferase
MERTYVTTTTPGRIDPAALRARLERREALTVIDVRTPAEFETVRIPGSVNAPLAMIEKHARQLAERLHRDVVLVCRSGNRARQAQQRLAGAGAGRLHVLDGGVGSYEIAGGEVVRGPARWSLERQVRLVAGFLVLGSSLTGLRAPWAGMLAGGVGAGLTISALTDTCTPGRVLSSLPYNRGPRSRTPEEILDQLPTWSPA